MAVFLCENVGDAIDVFPTQLFQAVPAANHGHLCNVFFGDGVLAFRRAENGYGVDEEQHAFTRRLSRRSGA